MVIFDIWLAISLVFGNIVYVYVVLLPASISFDWFWVMFRKVISVSTVRVVLPVFFIVSVMFWVVFMCMGFGMIIEIISSLGVSFIRMVIVCVFLFPDE